jgi:hypothetical protein
MFASNVNADSDFIYGRLVEANKRGFLSRIIRFLDRLGIT